jgi:hypothetical protein
MRTADVRRKLAATVVSIASVALVAASCRAGSVAKTPASTPTAVAQETAAPTAPTPASCGAERRFLPTQSQLPVAAQYVDAQKPVKVLAGLALQYDDRQIAVSPRAGSLVTTEYEGADVPSDESQITIRVPIGDYVVTLDLQGGTDLDWNDVLPYWIKINSLLLGGPTH